MISVTFMGLPVSVYQDDKISYSIAYKESREYSGHIYAAVSPITTTFPRSFDCYTENVSEINNLSNKIGAFGTLIISGISYSNCYISSLGDKFEVIRGSGKYTYTIQFSQAVTEALTDQVYATEETVHIYTDRSLAAGEELDSLPILLRGLAYVNVSVENKGISEDLEIKLYGSYDQVGTSKYPMFLSVLDNTPEGNTSGGTISGPPNYGFLHIKNADMIHSTTFDFTVSKVATR